VSSAAGWADAHASQIKSVAQGVGTACGLVSLIGVADMVTVPCLLVANGVALAADIDLAAHGQQGWDTVGMDVLGAGASVVGGGAVVGDASQLASVAERGGGEASTLFHYTNESGVNGILDSGVLNPSLKSVNPTDVRYGNGQYLTDICSWNEDAGAGVAGVDRQPLPGGAVHPLHRDRRPWTERSARQTRSVRDPRERPTQPCW
jgi:hypothetical protein